LSSIFTPLNRLISDCYYFLSKCAEYCKKISAGRAKIVQIKQGKGDTLPAYNGCKRRITNQRTAEVKQVDNLALTIIIPIIVVFAVCVLGLMVKYSMSDATLMRAKEIIKDVVYAVEQTMPDVPGQSKKQTAIELAQLLCKQFGVKLDDAALAVLIESTVFMLRHPETNK